MSKLETAGGSPLLAGLVSDAPLGRPSLGVADVVADELRREIATGAILPGTPLRQEEIARRFGVSQMPVREGLRKLVTERLALLQPNRGVLVAALTIAEVEELIELRVLLEARLLERSIVHLKSPDYTKLDRLLVQIGRTDLQRQPAEVLMLSEAFHWELYRRAGLPHFLATITSARLNLNRYAFLAWSALGTRWDRRYSHAELLDVSRSGEIARARRLLTEHIRETGRTIVDFMEQEVQGDSRNGRRRNSKPAA